MPRARQQAPGYSPTLEPMLRDTTASAPFIGCPAKVVVAEFM